MPSNQKIVIIGHLAKDPEMSNTPDGMAIAKFSIPVQDYYDKQQDRTNWFNCVAFKGTAERVGQYLAAGDLVQLELKKSDSSWEGNDGKRRYKSEFIVLEIIFLRVKYFEEGRSEGGSPNYPQPDDDIPF